MLHGRRLDLETVRAQARIDLVYLLARRLDEADVKAARIPHRVGPSGGTAQVVLTRLDERQHHAVVVAQHLHAGVPAAGLQVEVLRQEGTRLQRIHDREIQVIQRHFASP